MTFTPRLYHFRHFPENEGYFQCDLDEFFFAPVFLRALNSFKGVSKLVLEKGEKKDAEGEREREREYEGI